MSKLSDVSTALFNGNGTFDPEIFKTGVAIKRKVNFALAKPTGSTNYAFLPLPKGFVLTGLYVEETKKCSASSTVTVKAEADSATIGAAVNVGGSTLAKSFLKPVAATTAKDAAGTGTVNVPGGDKVFVDGDMLCLVAGASFTDGEIEEKRLSAHEMMIWHQLSRVFFCSVSDEMLLFLASSSFVVEFSGNFLLKKVILLL